MNKTTLRKNLTNIAIVIFIISFIILHHIKPSFIYNNDGSLRIFGLGTKKKTILPIWLITIVLAILSYMLSLYIIEPKFIS